MEYEWVGYTGSAFIASTFVPQILQTYRTRDVNGISVFFILMNIMGTACMLFFSAANAVWPTVITNASLMVTLVCFLGMYVAFANAKAATQARTRTTVTV